MESFLPKYRLLFWCTWYCISLEGVGYATQIMNCALAPTAFETLAFTKRASRAPLCLGCHCRLAPLPVAYGGSSRCPRPSISNKQRFITPKSFEDNELRPGNGPGEASKLGGPSRPLCAVVQPDTGAMLSKSPENFRKNRFGLNPAGCF